MVGATRTRYISPTQRERLAKFVIYHLIYYTFILNMKKTSYILNLNSKGLRLFVNLNLDKY